MDIENVSVEIQDDLLFLTIRKHMLFMHYGKVGIDAESLYIHLMFTGKMQKTNSVWAKNVYLREGLDWSRERLQKAMDLLVDLGICERVQRRDEAGKITGSYINVSFKQSPMEITEVINHSPVYRQVEKPEGGKVTANALTSNINALTKNESAKTASTQAAAPQRVKSTVTLIRELFVSNGSTYYHDGKEARACKLLMTRYESDVEGFTERLLAFKEMIRTDTFFSKQPFSPSALNSLWNRIIVKSPTPSSAAPLPVESWEDYIYRIRRELADAGYEVGDITLDSELDALYSKHQKKIRNGRF